MSITEELREFIEGKAWMADNYAKALAIADRIDAEHEKECSRAWMRGHDVWASVGNEKVMAERGWVRLPKDADGVLIRVGDTLTDDAEFKSGGKVKGLMLDDQEWLVTFGRGWTDVSAHEWHHYHEPTVEDVLHDFAIACEDGGFSGPDVTQLIAEYAKKLRLAGDAK